MVTEAEVLSLDNYHNSFSFLRHDFAECRRRLILALAEKKSG